MSNFKELLSSLRNLHKYSILNNDEYYTDELWKMIIVLSELKAEAQSNENRYKNEIEKVRRKVPKWLRKKHQFNYQILNTYMAISNGNTEEVLLDDLVKHSKIEPKTFLGHYNGMKTISEHNHAKIFEENNKMITLWEPVSAFIENIFLEHKNDMTNSSVIDIRIGEFIKEHLSSIIKLCENDISELNNLESRQYSRDKLGLNSNYPFIALSEKIIHDDHDKRYWQTQYIINNQQYRFCSQFGGGQCDSSGKTRSQREGDMFRNYLIEKNILLDKYKNKNIHFIVG